MSQQRKFKHKSEKNQKQKPKEKRLKLKLQGKNSWKKNTNVKNSSSSYNEVSFPPTEEELYTMLF